MFLLFFRGIFSVLFGSYYMTLSRYLLSFPSFVNIFYLSFKLHCQIFCCLSTKNREHTVSSAYKRVIDLLPNLCFMDFPRQLLVYSCWGWLLFGCLSETESSSPKSSIRVYLNLVGIYFVVNVLEFLNQIPCIPSWPSIFQFCTFWVLLWAISGVFLPRGLLRVLVILFSCYLSIRPFSYVVSVPIFYFKMALIPFNPVVDLPTCILHQLNGNVFVCYFWNMFFVVLLDFVSILFKFSFFRQYLLIHLFKLDCQICPLFCFDLFSPKYFHVVLFHYHFACLCSFFNSPWSLISHPGFCFSVHVPLETTDFITA